PDIFVRLGVATNTTDSPQYPVTSSAQCTNTRPTSGSWICRNECGRGHRTALVQRRWAVLSKVILAVFAAVGWNAALDAQGLQHPTRSTKPKPATRYGTNPAAAKTFMHDPVKLYYEVYGAGDPVLLIHGNGSRICRRKSIISGSTIASSPWTAVVRASLATAR